MNIGITVKLEVGDDQYDITLNLPAKAPTVGEPFHFGVVSNTKKTPAIKNKLLEVAIVDKDHVFVAVAPPSALLSLTGNPPILESLNVQVSEGNYNPETGKFTDTVDE